MLRIRNGDHDMNEPGCYFRKIHNQLKAGFNRTFRKYFPKPLEARSDEISPVNTGVPE